MEHKDLENQKKLWQIIFFVLLNSSGRLLGTFNILFHRILHIGAIYYIVIFKNQYLYSNIQFSIASLNNVLIYYNYSVRPLTRHH